MSFSLISGTTWTWSRFHGRWYGVDGRNPPAVRLEDCTFRQMGLPAPDLAPVIAGMGAGGVVNRTLRMAYTFYDHVLGRESRLSPWSNQIRADHLKIGVSGFQLPYPGASRLRVYANLSVAPLRAFFVSEIPFTLSATLDWNDNTLGTEEFLDDQGLPPIGTTIRAIADRLYIAGTQEKSWTGQVILTNGTDFFELASGHDDFPGAYLVGERLVVSSYPGLEHLYIRSWDSARLRGRLTSDWLKSSGTYSYTLKLPRPALYWSSHFPAGAALPEGWNTEENVLYLPGEDSGDVTGLIGWGGPYSQHIFVMTEECLWATNLRHDPFQKIEVETGTRAPRSVHVGYRGLVYWVGTDGQIYAFNGRECVRASMEVQETLHARVNQDRTDEAFAVYDPKTQRQFFWLPEDVSAFFCLWWDHPSGQMFIADISAANAWAVDELSNATDQESFVLVKIGSSYFIIVYDGSSTAGAFDWKSAHFPRPGQGKYMVGRVLVQFNEVPDPAEEITLSILDEDGTTVATDTYDIDREDMYSFFRSNVGAFQVRIQSTDRSWEVRRIDLQIKPFIH